VEDPNPTEHKQDLDSITMSGRLQAEHIHDAKRVGYRERDDHGTNADADLASGAASQTVSRPPSHNEDDMLEACRILISALRACGEDWMEPEEGQGAADCVACHRVSRRTLEIQVVRADVSPEAWRSFSAGQTHAPPPSQIAGLANTLKGAVEHKTGPGALAPSSRNRLVLALNARSLPRLAFDDVVIEFRSRFGNWCRGLGFTAVWLVGPTQTMTHRLDMDSNVPPN
jgi:hypothetical protein